MFARWVFCIAWFVTASTALAETATTEYGQVEGSRNGTVLQFLGIPFARPPVGELRWRAPQPPEKWQGVLNTTQFAPACPQKQFEQGGGTGTVVGDEDCLYLNVWTPQTAPAELPVLFFIHGGGNQQGSTQEFKGGTQLYFGKNMAERGPCVVVTVQYRLGPLGFLVHPGLEPESPSQTAGNYATLDLILALQWVQKNIAAFGGDPTQVMIFGESAGGLNVGNLLTTPLAQGLFQRACIQSATPVLGSYSVQQSNAVDYVNGYIATGSDTEKMAHLRSLPFSELVKNETPPVEGGVVGLQWQSVVDGAIYFDTPARVFQGGHFNQVPLLIGSNSEEMSLGAPATVTPAMVNALISVAVPASLQDQARSLYPPGNNNTEAKKSYIGILTDGQFTSTARRTAQCVSLNQTQQVWRYFFTHKHRPALLASLGSYHGMELFYVFNNWENATLGSGVLFSPGDHAVQTMMLRYWVNFARTGNPNGNGLEPWPPYHAATDCYLEIQATPSGSLCGLRTAQSDFWDQVVKWNPCTPAEIQRLRISSLSPTQLEIQAAPAATYTLEFSNSLNPPSWSTLAAIPAGSNRVVRVTDTSPQESTRFYRILTP